MEFNEKLQELRKKKGLTQEELAEALYVSRTAISKWESGRGYPNLDSLKEIAKYFSVTIDELLSTDEVLTIAEKDNNQKEQHLRSLVFGLLDISVIMFFFLPFFGQKENGILQEVSLLFLNEIATYLSIAYYAIVISIAVYGILTLTFQNCQKAFWAKSRDKISLIFNTVAVFLFIISSQVYAGSLLFIFLAIKALMLIHGKYRQCDGTILELLIPSYEVYPDGSQIQTREALKMKRKVFICKMVRKTYFLFLCHIFLRILFFYRE